MVVRRGMAAVVVASLVVGASAACSALVDLGGLQAPSPGDAGPSGDGPVGRDAAGEGAAPEAGADAGRPLCAGGTHLVCTDFEADDLLAGGFTALQRNGTLEATTAQAVSPSRSLSAGLARRSGGENVYNTLVCRGSHWRRVHLEMDVFLEPAKFEAGDVSMALALVYFTSGSTFTGTNLFFHESSNAASIEHLEGSERYFDVPTLRRGAWSHVVLDFDPVAGAYTWRVDGAAGGRSFTGIPAPSGPVTLSVEVGLIAYGTPTPAVRVYFDNVVVDLP